MGRLCKEHSYLVGHEGQEVILIGNENEEADNIIS